jgi:hypothetical protein
MSGQINMHMKMGALFLVLLLAGCAGQQAFTPAARPGETILLAAGWQQRLTRNNLMVMITAQNGEITTYNPGDPRVRTVIQSYPDPVSKLVVSDRAKVTYPASGYTPNGGVTYNDLSPDFGGYTRNMTGQENDWSNTAVLIDLPIDLSPGAATIKLLLNGVSIVKPPIDLDVLPVVDAAERNHLSMSNASGASGLIRAIERAPHFVVRFVGPDGVIPYSMQADFGRTLAPTGNAWVTHGRGDIQNIMWSDNGATIRTLLMPTNGVTVDRLSDFKFYVTGAVTSLTVDSVLAYDVSGNLLPGFSATIESVDN